MVTTRQGTGRRWGSRAGLATAIVVAVLAWAAPAFAHVSAGGSDAGGGRTEVTFSFRHGCDGQPTTGLRVQLPEGTQDVEVPDKAGWNYGVNAGVINWTGGSVPDGDDASFVATMVIPGQVGQTVFFPTVQSCPDGEEAWIDETPDPEAPTAAPRIQLVVAGPTTTTTAEPTTTTTAPTTTTSTSTTTTTAASTTTSTRPGTTIPLQPAASDSSPWPWIILVLLAAIGAAVIGVLLWQRSKDRAADADGGPPGPPTGQGPGVPPTGQGPGTPPTGPATGGTPPTGPGTGGIPPAR